MSEAIGTLGVSSGSNPSLKGTNKRLINNIARLFDAFSVGIVVGRFPGVPFATQTPPQALMSVAVGDKRSLRVPHQAAQPFET